MSRDFFYKQCLGFLNTPPLWVGEQFGMQQFDFPDIDLEGFAPHAIPLNIRLGHQMEHIFKQLLNHCREYAILLHNLPIRDGNRTIGEIDFILNERSTGTYIHVELTYKFYIINPEITEPIHRLMGPNRHDMFFTKMEKIKNEQFQLLHSKEGDKALLSKGLNSRFIAHQVCYKAQLFPPYGAKSIHIRPLNKSCVSGHWLRFDDFNTQDFRSFQYYIPYKSQWVIEPHDDVPWNSHYKTLMEINLKMLKENAPMVWIKKSEMEFEKVFVVWW